jgi:hypothetical protein
MLTTNAERLATYERRTGWLLTVAAVLFLVVASLVAELRAIRIELATNKGARQPES